VFTIVIGNNPNLCLDLVRGAGLSLLQIWECNGHENQLWYFDAGAYKIQWAGDRSKCIDAGGGLRPGTQVFLWDCNGSPQQKWGFASTNDAIYLADSQQSDASLCMDIAGQSTALGTAVQIWGCNGLWNQQWGLQHGITIRAQADYHMCIDAAGGCMRNGCPIYLWECNGHTNQKWFWDWGSYTIRSAMDSNKCIDAGSNMATGNSLMIWDCNEAPQQKWSFDTQLQTIVLGTNPTNQTTCMDISAGQVKNGTNMQIWHCNVCWNQQFQVTGPLVQMESETSQLGGSQASIDFPNSASTPEPCPPSPSPHPKPTPPGPSAKVLKHCAAGSQYSWPEFKNAADLKKSPWGQYIQTVYGEIPTDASSYPICTYSFTHLYKPILAQAKVPRSHGPMNTHCPTKAGEYYSIMTDHQDAWSSWIWNPNLIEPAATSIQKGLPSDYWVEIIHQAYPMDGHATWMYYAPGTGIWFHLGNTKTWKDHDNAVLELLKEKCQGGSGWGPNDHQCIPQFPKLYQAAIKAGLNSMQFWAHSDMPCGSEHHRQNMAVEIVDLGGPGTTSCGMEFKGGASSGKARYRAGWEAKHECTCDNRQTTVNCKGYGINFIR